MDMAILNENWATMTVEQRRMGLIQLEESCKALEGTAGVEIPPVEYFCNGVYAREITIPKGTVLVGEIHLQDQINVVSKGTILVATDEGVRTINAPCTFISPAGTKRAGFVLEETTWTVFHATNHTNEEAIRKDFIARDYTTLDKQLENNKCHG